MMDVFLIYGELKGVNIVVLQALFVLYYRPS